MSENGSSQPMAVACLYGHFVRQEPISFDADLGKPERSTCFVSPDQINPMVLALGVSACDQPLNDCIADNFSPETPAALRTPNKCSQLKQTKVAVILRR